MNSRHVSAAHAEQIQAAIASCKRYLDAQAQRMKQLAFPQEDRIYWSVIEARDAVERLWLDLHYHLVEQRRRAGSA